MAHNKPIMTKSKTTPLPPVNISPPEINNVALLEDDWYHSQLMGTPSSVSSNLFDICRCCGRQECENLEFFNRTMKKLESDTRLAAEIGQGLLHKHETHVAESNQQRAQLEKQLQECHERIAALEQSLDEVENSKDEVTKEKNKWHWEYQKRQKILDETIADLETVNEKCHQLSGDLKTKTAEIEKLRIYKFMTRHSESREEALTAKLEDANQELAICRKNELVLESKIKKLKMRYESLHNSHEQLTKQVQDSRVVEIRPNSTIKFVPSNDNNASATDLIDLIKELSSANTKLKTDLMNCKEQLSEAHGEIIALNQKIDDNEQNPKNGHWLQDDMKTKLRRTTSVKDTKKLVKSKSLLPPPLPTASTSMPTSSSSQSNYESKSAVVHHHYHYYVKNNKGEHVQITDEMDQEGEEDEDEDYGETINKHTTIDMYDGAHQQQQPNQRELVLSPSASSIITVKDGTVTSLTRSPFVLLQEHVAQVLDRLRGSDIRALNRRLKRAFDITELSNMSNSIIDNILIDVDILDTRFLWVDAATDDMLDGFMPLLNLLKDMLKELGMLRNTVNELQVEYVKKVEESEIRVEKEIIQKRQLKRQSYTTMKSTTSTPTARPLSWFANMFAKGSNNTIAPIENKNSPKTDQHDRVSTLTKVTTDSSTLIQSLEEEETLLAPRKLHEDHRHTIPPPPPPRQSSMLDSKRRQIIPHFTNSPPIMTTSTSNTTLRSSPSIPIRSKRSLHRMHIDYEGIGPAAIRPIPSDCDNKVVNFSSSWLGGK